VKALAELQQLPPAAESGAAWRAPERIVYVSCNPATLARDADVLVHQAGYRCTRGGVVNMFPHTAHVESIAVFELDAAKGQAIV
jgi:23S rRNA (uracil1939-C5)-methyltransferase